MKQFIKMWALVVCALPVAFTSCQKETVAENAPSKPTAASARLAAQPFVQDMGKYYGVKLKYTNYAENRPVPQSIKTMVEKALRVAFSRAADKGGAGLYGPVMKNSLVDIQYYGKGVDKPNLIYTTDSGIIITVKHHTVFSYHSTIALKLVYFFDRHRPY